VHNRLKAIALALFVAACSGGSKATVSLTARTAPVGQALTVAGGVTLTRVRIVIQKIELERALIEDGGSQGDEQQADEQHGDEQELAVGPFLIDLQGAQLDNGINKVFTVTTDPGVYKEITFKIHKLEAAEAGSDPALAQMTGFSIRIEGTRNGTPFTFNSSLDEEQEREGNFTLHAGENNIAFKIDPSGWFMNGATPLDPSDPLARSQIESNIKASIDAFEDDGNQGHR
jgi:hypothetical protein